MKAFWHVARLLLGLVFIFSGFVKGIDPWGSAYKFTDYFNAWDMESLVPLALPLGIMLSASEFIAGLALVANVLISFFSAIALLFMLFFTGITLVVALNNPVTDCGCFGDALVLTNWQTFYKNIVLLILAILVFRYRKRFGPKKQSLITIVLSALTISVFGYLADYSFNHLPIIDFRPYKIGTNIPRAMMIPGNAPQDIYENTFTYRNKKSGTDKKFTEKNYPWQDSLNWEFVSMDSKLIRKGYEPSIHNFMIETADGEDIKDFFLYDKGYTFIFIVQDPGNANQSKMPAINQLAGYAINNQMNFIGLTSATQEQTEQFKAENNLTFDFFNCDEITLKTMIRSNPGLILIKNGIILDKWHYQDIPSPEEIKKQLAYFEKNTKNPPPVR